MGRIAEFEIPTDLLGRYLMGQATAKEVARDLRVSQTTILKRLRALGVDTTKGRYKFRELTRHIEQRQNLPAGTAATTVAALYRTGLSTYEVSDRLQCTRQRAWRLLQRAGVPLRPRFYRAVFMTAAGRHRSMHQFSARLRQMRRVRRWSQDYLGRLCGVSKTSIGFWERGIEGPSWETLHRLAKVLNVGLIDLGITWKPIV